MATDQLFRLFAEQNRVRAFAAVALGAETTEQVAEVAGLTPKGTALALLKLREQGVLKTMDDGELRVDYDLFRNLAREAQEPAEEGPVTGDEHTDMILRTFVRGGRLIRLPAQWTRKQVVLQHIAEQTFAPGVEYPERTVNEKLRAWCDEGEVDHVTLRRYLVDLHHLRRGDGIYQRVGA
ncbi:hypothetical protein SAMN05216489_03826 [Streptomyces sp. 3213]|uniref:DUF2087 domain-containing protein n=1 Tax=Streptomyces sp. 3213.3 TaxID=1855348 RepID=UPI000897F0B4|nr:DUF2087 domain-containing protein [Streptomyces sp. 3213.3]SED57753.1 hypothetical protein SAMN05216489_03826 [Streptomyces sp. 3213] [Streptomyces sp. 3213.3]